MEVVGGVASVIGIATAAAQIATQAATVYAQLRDAPSELASLRTSVGLLQNILEQIVRLRIEVSLPAQVQQSFHKGLSAAEQNLDELQQEYIKHGPPQGTCGKRARIKWALVSSRAVARIEQRIQATLTYINTIIHLAEL